MKKLLFDDRNRKRASILKMTVSKKSLRRFLGMKRLPDRFRMLVPGSWLYDVLKANRMHKLIQLGFLTYWVIGTSAGRKETMLNLVREGADKRR